MTAPRPRHRRRDRWRSPPCRYVIGEHLLRQRRQPDPALRDLRARAERAGRLCRAGVARPCRAVRRGELCRRLAARRRLRPRRRHRRPRSSIGLVVHRGLRRAGAARDRHQLHHDHAGARRDPVGPRLSLDQPHQRRQRHQRARRGRRRSASRSTRPNAFYYATLDRLPARRRASSAIFVRSPFGASACAARATSRAA